MMDGIALSHHQVSNSTSIKRTTIGTHSQQNVDIPSDVSETPETRVQTEMKKSSGDQTALNHN